jgi:hypothetical protein|tara:strand:+ start:12180 stop:12704 length:525 start_codon:yes stop_codon:yes gene_type:complete
MMIAQPRTLECESLGRAMSESSGSIPGPNKPLEERLLFLQENMVNFVNQYDLPVVEVALVISKYIRIIASQLQNAAEESGEDLPISLLEPWPIDSERELPRIDSFPLERVLDSVDQDRMEIFDTIIRTILNETEMPFVSAITVLRDWESKVRIQLSESTSPGHLFSPMKLPDGF